MMDPFRAESLSLHELCSKPPKVAEFILTNPKTCIRSFDMTDFLNNSVTATSTKFLSGGHLANLLCNFLQNNQTLERILLILYLNRNSRITEPSNIRMWTMASSKNPNIKILEVGFSSLDDSNIVDATHVLQPLSSSSTSTKITLHLGQSGAIGIGENFWHFARTISELRGLHSLGKEGMHPMLVSGILNTMKKSKFPLLQKLEVNDTCTETLNMVGCFLDSRAAPSLEEIDLGQIKKLGQASMEILVHGLKKSDSVQTLKLYPNHLDQMAAEGFAKYIAEAPPSLRNLVLSKNKSGCRDMLATINAALCSNRNIQKLALHDFGHQKADLVKELLLKTQSLKSLEILGRWDNSVSELGAKLLEGLKSNATLTSLVLGLPTSLYVRPLVEALEERSTSLKTLNLVCNDDTQKLLVPAICDWLRNPLCCLENLSLACKINHAEVLPLLLNGDTSKTLVNLRLFCQLEGLNLSTEMGWKMVTILPKLKLEQLSVFFAFSSRNRYEYNEEAAMNIEKAVEAKMVQNQHLEHLSLKIFPNWRVSGLPEELPKELQIRNKSIKVAKSLQDNKIPMALVPLMMKKIHKKCQYLPKMANYDSLSSTLIYSMLRTQGPRSDMMKSVKSYFLPQDDQEDSPQP